MSKRSEYDVGYGKPPKKSQFKKCQSGNPRGRSKGSRNFDTIFRQIGDQKVKIKDGEGSRYVTKREAIVMQLTNKAAAGDLKAIRDFIRLDQSISIEDKDLIPPPIRIEFIEAENGKPKYPQHNGEE